MTVPHPPERVRLTPPLTLILAETPSANRYWRHVGSRVVLSREAREYRLLVASQFRQQTGTSGVTFPVGPVAVRFRWVRSRKSGDLDNRSKQLFDALTGLAYTDDRQIVEIHATRADEANAGRMEVEIWAA